MASEKTPVLYLSYDGLTDPLGQSQILPYIIGLAQRGYSFTVISTEKQDNYRKRAKFVDSLIQPFGADIDWQPIFYTKKPPVLSTLLDAWRMRRRAIRLHKQKKFKIVHCRSYVTALVGGFLQEKYGLAFVFDMRGFWADERVEGGLWNLEKKLYRRIYDFFKRKEKEFLQQANFTISLTASAKREILSWEGFANVPIQVIPCCVDMKLFSSEKLRAAYLDQWWNRFNILPEELVVSYLGSLGTWYMVDEMLQFYQVLERRYPESKFLFITPDDPQIVMEKVRRMGMEQRKFVFYRAERTEVPVLLKLSQVSLFFIRPSFSKKASSPTKMGEILATGVPVICNAGVGDTDLLMESHQLGGLIRDFTEPEYERIVNELDGYLKLPPEQLRQAALEHFDLQRGVELYGEVYDGIMKETLTARKPAE